MRGAIVGAAKLLGLGLGLSRFAGDMEREVLVGLVAPLPLITLEFVFASRSTDVRRVPATDAGRVRLFMSELEGVRLIAGGVQPRTRYNIENQPSQVSMGGRTHSSKEVCDPSWPGERHFG
jgi:hypothetical protein